MAIADQGQYVDIDGIRTFYIRKGSGHPVILLHGSAPGGSSTVVWQRNIDHLSAAGYSVIAFDQPGYGLTDSPTDHSAEYRLRHAKAFIDKIGCDAFHMIANSQGAYTAGRIALEDPRAAKLVCTASGSIAPRGSAEAQALSKQHIQELDHYKPTLENMRTLTEGTIFDKTLVTDELVKLRYEMSIGRNNEARLKRAEVPPPRAITEDLRNLKCRTLLLWGKNDRGVAIERGVLLFQLIPDAELHVFDKCGHWCQWDQTDRFHALVTDFLK
jgi:2-hydroxy-6-oxonona-2,4-dienedioate hydrolase